MAASIGPARNRIMAVASSGSRRQWKLYPGPAASVPEGKADGTAV